MDRAPVTDTGLSTLHVPEEPIVDIVFVHGLQGHPRRTWTKNSGHGAANSKRGWKRWLGPKRKASLKGDLAQDVFWPADLLPSDCPDARILTFGYNSIVASFLGDAVNQNHPSANARNLLYALSRLRKDCSLILSEALRRAENAEDSTLRNFQHSLRAIVFLGTPHRGSGYAPIGEVVRRVYAAIGIDTSDRNLRILRYDSPELEMAREEFTRQWRQGGFAVKTFQEARGFKSFQGLNEKIVPDFSSSLDDPRENAEHIDANHMEMCRFAGKLDTGYIQVSRELANMVDIIMEVKGAPLEASNRGSESNSALSNDELACLQSISFPEMDSRYHSISKPLNGTCEWLSQRPEYGLWRSPESSSQQSGLLWIKGKPGAGKSTLMKMLVGQIQSQIQRQEAITLRFFFDAQRNSDLEKTMLGLFRSLVCQLLQHTRSMFRTLLPLHRRKIDAHGSDWQWHVQELREALLDMILVGAKGPVYVIIDAVDECNEAEMRDIVVFMQDLLSYSSEERSVKVCLSSRYYPTINVENGLEIQLDQFNTSDIQTYIERWLRPSADSPGLSRLVSDVLKKASGVFLWVVLVVNTLVKARDEGETRSRMLEIVRDLPKQLDDLIRQILRSIEPHHARDAVSILQWTILSQRPVSTTELRYALEAGRKPAHESQQHLVSSQSFVLSDDQMERLIRARTKGLVEVKRRSPGQVPLENDHTESSDAVQCIHGSIRAFMLHHGGFEILDSSLKEGSLQSNQQLGATCITYLGCSDIQYSLAKISEPETMTRPEASKTLTNLYALYPLLEYTIDGTFSHIAKAQHCNSFLSVSRETMLEMQSIFGTWRRLSDLELAHRYRELRGPTTDFGNVAAEYGITNWVMKFIHQGCSVNNTGGCHHTILNAASLRGHEDLVEKLLEAGADINIGGGRYGSPLSYAALSGNPQVVQTLLARGSDVNAVDGEYGTALQTAAHNSPANEVIIDLLLRAGANVNVTGGYYGNALQATAFAGNEATVKRLIEAGADVNMQGGEYGTALQAAASMGHHKVVTALLSKGADPHAQSDNCGSALWEAAYGGHLEVVRHLLALDLASSITSHVPHAGALDFAEMLDRRTEEIMEKGRDVNRFHGAVDQGDVAILQDMLAKGVDVNVRGGEFSSAWHTAAFLGYTDVMSVLLAQSDANPNLKDSSGRTALWFAASEGHVLVVRQLLSTSLIDTNVCSVSGRNLLWWPCSRGFVDIVDLLLKVRVDPHEEDEDGASPMMIAKEEGREAVLKLLLQAKQEENSW